MLKYFNTISDERGNVLPNYRLQVVDSLGAIVPIYADKAGTRFRDASGNIVNYATAKNNGRVSFYWEAAEGQVLQTLDISGDLVDSEVDFADTPAFVQTSIADIEADLGDKANIADVPTKIELASTGASQGAEIVGFAQPATRARNRTAKQKLAEQISVLDFYDDADGTDYHPAFQAAVDYAASIGGGVVRMPYVAGAVNLSDTVLVTSSNIRIELDVPLITLTKTAAAPSAPAPAPFTGIMAFSFQGAIRTAPQTVIENCALVSTCGETKIDCNGRNVTGYTHVGGVSTPEAAHHGVFFVGCVNPVVSGIDVYNGLIGGITFLISPGAKVDKCAASHSVYDNGIYVFYNDEYRVARDFANPETWNNSVLTDCRAWNCANHGLGIYGAIGVTYINPKIWNCGNNTGTADAGPAGGLGIERANEDTEDGSWNYHFLAVNPYVEGSYGFAIRTNCNGTTIRGGKVKNVRAATNYTDAVNPIWGSGVFVQNKVKADIECDIDGASYSGLRVQGDIGKYPDVRFKGRVENCGRRGVLAISFARVTLDPACEFINNGDAGNNSTDEYVIFASNSAGNVDAGELRISGDFRDNKGGVANFGRIGTATLKAITGRNNGTAWSSAFPWLHAPTAVGTLIAADIQFSDDLGKMARVLKADAVTTSILNRQTIKGNQTNLGAARADVTATNHRGDLYLRTAWDIPSMDAGARTTRIFTVPGAAVGDQATVSPGGSLGGLLAYAPEVGNGGVTVTLFNPTGATIDRPSSDWTILVTKV